MDDLTNRCVARRLALLEGDPWLASLDDDGQCEAVVIAYLLGVEDARGMVRDGRTAIVSP